MKIIYGRALTFCMCDLRSPSDLNCCCRYLKKKEEKCEPPKVTLQIWPKGIKLVAESLRHFVPSHAVTYVSQGQPPEDDIVSVILLIYNPITKCPVHLHSYRCDSVETADLLRHQLQSLANMPDNIKKIRDLEDRLQSQGLVASKARLLKSCDTGIGGSHGDLLGSHSCSSSSSSSSESDNTDESERITATTNARKDPEEERIARLYDSLAAELRHKLGNSKLSLNKEHDMKMVADKQTMAGRGQAAAHGRPAGESKTAHLRQLPRHADNGSSSGLSSGIGSDLDDSADRSKVRENPSCSSAAAAAAVVVVDDVKRQAVKQSRQQRYSYHESGTSQRKVIERVDSRRQIGKSMVDVRLEEGRSGREFGRSDSFNVPARRFTRIQERLEADGASGRVKEAVSKFQVQQTSKNAIRSKSFHEEKPWVPVTNKYPVHHQQVRATYQELDQRDRFPGLDRETARLDHIGQGLQHLQHQQRNIQRYQSTEMLTSSYGLNRASVRVVVEPVGDRKSVV